MLTCFIFMLKLIDSLVIFQNPQNQTKSAKVTMHLHLKEGNMEEIKLLNTSKGIVGVIDFSEGIIR